MFHISNYIKNIRYNIQKHSITLPFRLFPVSVFINLIFLWMSAEIAFLVTLIFKNAPLANITLPSFSNTYLFPSFALIWHFLLASHPLDGISSTYLIYLYKRSMLRCHYLLFRCLHEQFAIL